MATELLALVVALELFNLGISIVNSRQLGVDPVAREGAAEARERAKAAHTRITDHHGAREADQ